MFSLIHLTCVLPHILEVECNIIGTCIWRRWNTECWFLFIYLFL